MQVDVDPGMARGGSPARSCEEYSQLLAGSRPVDPDPIAAAVSALVGVDALMSRALRAIAYAGPSGGLPADRLVSLTAGATGWDVRFLTRCAEVLRAMPGLWLAFDHQQVSWSQLRGIVQAAKGLSTVDRGRLDDQLAAAIAQNRTTEPDRLVEVAEDLACRLDDLRQRDRERAADRAAFLHLQPHLFGGVDIHGHVDDIAGAIIADAIHTAADDPVAEDAGRPRDADDRPIPGTWLPPTARGAQLVEGLRRVCQAFNDGVDATAGARTTALVVVDVNDLDLDAADLQADAPNADDLDTEGDPAAQPEPPAAAGGVPAATARLLWHLAGGRTRLSRARIHALTCDAAFVPVLTDGTRMLAVGDCHDPITRPLRRAVAARDQGCRFPGCSAPIRWTDVHHVVARTRRGKTYIRNLVALCRACHTRVHDRGWLLTLRDDGTLVVERGRYRFTSRPPLRPPPRPTSSVQPVTA